MLARKYWYLSCVCISIVYAEMSTVGKPPAADPVPPTCGCWQEQALNDIATADRHCMQAYLQQYMAKAKQASKVENQQFSLPIVGGFPAQRLTV